MEKLNVRIIEENNSTVSNEEQTARLVKEKARVAKGRKDETIE